MVELSTVLQYWFIYVYMHMLTHVLMGCDICVMCVLCVCVCDACVWCVCMCGCVVCGVWVWLGVCVCIVHCGEEWETYMGRWQQLVFLSHTDWVWNGSIYIQVSTREWKLVRANTFLFSVISHTGAVSVAPFTGLLPHCETKSGRRPRSEATVSTRTLDLISKAGISAKCIV